MPDGRDGTPLRVPSQCDRILAVLSDRQKHTVTEIHAAAGFCRLNSRVAELRGRGYDIRCERVAGANGPSAYLYQLIASPLDAASSCWGAASSGGNSPTGAPSPGTDGAAARLNQQLALT